MVSRTIDRIGQSDCWFQLFGAIGSENICIEIEIREIDMRVV